MLRPRHIVMMGLCGACGSHAPGGVVADLPDAAAPGRGQPRPLLLVHGLDGFQHLGPIDYFYGVAPALAADGVDVHAPALDPYNSSDVRGAELLAAIEEVRADTGAAQVDLVCHSQGGLDCRYAASQAPDEIANVVTIAAPHRGTPLVDIALAVAQGPTRDAMNAILNLLGTVISSNPDQDAQAALTDLSSAGAADFAQRHPDGEGVAYYSIAGRSGLSSGDGDCTPDLSVPFVARWTGTDPMDPLLVAPAAILDGALAGRDGHDGLVPVASARWGTFLGCLPADHMDEICQLAGDAPGAGNDFDCVAFYRELAAWLGDAPGAPR